MMNKYPRLFDVGDLVLYESTIYGTDDKRFFNITYIGEITHVVDGGTQEWYIIKTEGCFNNGRYCYQVDELMIPTIFDSTPHQRLQKFINCPKFIYMLPIHLK